ncbi:MAG: hypothetical protein V6Z82_00575 [Flavobacteriales bacterium]
MKNALYCLAATLLLTGCARDEGLTTPDIQDQPTQKLRFVLKAINTHRVQNGGDQASTNPFDNSYLFFTYRNTTNDMNSSRENKEKKPTLFTIQTLRVDRQGISEGLELIPGSYLAATFIVYNMGKDKKQGTGDDYSTFYTSKSICFTIEPHVPKNILLEVIPTGIYPFPKRGHESLIAGEKVTFSIKGLTKRWLFFELKVAYENYCIGKYTLTIKRGGDMIYSQAFDAFEEDTFVSRTIDTVYDTSRTDDFQLFVTKKDSSTTVSGKATIKYSDLEDKQDYYTKHYAEYPSLVFIALN